MTMKMFHLWHPLKKGLKAKTKKMSQHAVASSYKNFFLIKNEIIYLMRKSGLV